MLNYFFLFIVPYLLCHQTVSCSRLIARDQTSQPQDVQINFYSNVDTKNLFETIKKENDNILMAVSTKSTEVPNETPTDSTPLDHWSIIWYIASFGGLILFFLIVSCSEWCCRRAVRSSASSCHRPSGATPTPVECDTPPPSYDQFAPPSYESICLGAKGSEKCEFDIYVVPVHALPSLIPDERHAEDEPPSYNSAATKFERSEA